MKVTVFFNHKNTFMKANWVYALSPEDVLEEFKAIRLYNDVLERWVTIPVASIYYIEEENK